jgi:hypothetical protein
MTGSFMVKGTPLSCSSEGLAAPVLTCAKLSLIARDDLVMCVQSAHNKLHQISGV